MSNVLFCTDVVAARHGDRLRAIDPDIEFVTLDGDDPVSADDISRITLAFFSHDAWPERAANFFGVALRAANLEWFHTMSAGVDHPVFRALVDHGAILTNSAGTSAEPIAGTAIMYLLALSRDLPRMMRDQARSEWVWAPWSELDGASVAVVGYGPIGRHVARLGAAHGMRPVVVRRAVRGDEGHPARPLSELADVVRDADAVVVALPLAEETRGLVSAELIAAMRPGALFVNVGRGELVDQPALTAALAEGRLGGAGLDVTDPEPLPADDPLWTLPNVIITPHNSGSTDGSDRRGAELFFENLGRWVRGDELLNRVERAGS